MRGTVPHAVPPTAERVRTRAVRCPPRCWPRPRVPVSGVNWPTSRLPTHPTGSRSRSPPARLPSTMAVLKMMKFKDAKPFSAKSRDVRKREADSNAAGMCQIVFLALLLTLIVKPEAFGMWWEYSRAFARFAQAPPTHAPHTSPHTPPQP